MAGPLFKKPTTALNNKHICIAPSGRNFRGAGARQRVSEQRKKRKPGKRVMSLA